MIYKFGHFVLDPETFQLSKNGTPQKIEPQIYALLELLITRPNTVISKEEIIQTVWNGRHVSDATINSRIHAARAAIDDNGSDQRLIKTVPHVGLRFVGKVKVERKGLDTPAASIPPGRKVPFSYRRLLWLIPVGAAGIFGLKALQGNAYPESEFVFTSQAAIFGHNTTRIWGLSVEDCMRACLHERNFYCKSIDYTRVEKMCDLSDKSAEDVGGLKTDYPGNPHDHYARRNIETDKADALSSESRNRTAHELDMTLKMASSLLKDGSPESINLAADQFMAALTQDPNSAEALAGLAEANRLQCLNGHMDTSEVLPRLHRIVDRALTLSSDHPDVQTAAAAIALMEEDFVRANEYADRAIRHRHLHGAGAHHYKSLALIGLGRLEEAKAQYREVIFHEPDFKFNAADLNQIESLGITAAP